MSWKSWGFLLGGAALVLAACFVYLQVEQTRCAYRVAQLQQAYGKWYEVHRRLEIERTHLRSPKRLRALGRDIFGLEPARDDRLWTLEDPR
ncbi:MAG: hypothetical protein JG766_1644 [Desulfacinum sp.]|jgi:hypothetical protein|nr:hypothetical protein [Desulfacinum sp.]